MVRLELPILRPWRYTPHLSDSFKQQMRRFADRVIRWAQRGDMHSRRLVPLVCMLVRSLLIQQANSIVMHTPTINSVFKEFPHRYPTRTCGFTRIRKAGFRRGDNAPMSVIQFVEPDEEQAVRYKIRSIFFF